MKKLIVVVLGMFLFACSQNTVKDENTENSATNGQPIQTQQSEKPAVSSQESSQKVPQEKRISVPEEVVKKFKSVIIAVSDKKSNKDFETEVLIGQKAQAVGTNLTIEVEYYLPDFVMDANSFMTSKSADENNPAAKVKIYKAQELVFDGWLFKNFPDMHPFVDEDYAISLKGSVLK
ncbi:MAG: hypothetical protein PWQ25_304 [Deferribacteres bacterium]|jgi:hypothetical protein|nr:hypothetical protein [Deferribacteraceae bacterium]MDK2791441.1 hypothetical protein [Deferribacteres bacterium]